MRGGCVMNGAGKEIGKGLERHIKKALGLK
jgi:hypothetical protein